MRLIRQCCGGECIMSKHCEELAYQRYSKQHGKHWLRLMLTNPVVLFILGILIGITIGKL